MNDSRSLVGRQKEVEQLRRSCAERRQILLVGPAGVGKTALIRHAQQYCPLLLCEETSSLRRICESLERQLGWTHRKMNVVERKNRLLPYLARRNQMVVLDGVSLTPPRVARFIGNLIERVPVWITCRSAQPKEIGAVWEHLYRFERVELGPLSLNETAALLKSTISPRRLPTLSRDQISRLHRLAKGNPRVLEELLIELGSREYRLDESFDWKLLELDRRIHNVASLAAVH
jgi:predicted ATPase